MNPFPVKSVHTWFIPVSIEGHSVVIWTWPYEIKSDYIISAFCCCIGAYWKSRCYKFTIQLFIFTSYFLSFNNLNPCFFFICVADRTLQNMYYFFIFGDFYKKKHWRQNYINANDIKTYLTQIWVEIQILFSVKF